MPHAPTKDVTTTETVTDRDVTITKVIRDHDELGQHVHKEVVDKMGPGDHHTHTETTEIEKDGETVHKEVVERDAGHGTHVHKEVTDTDKNNTHVQKTVTDTDVDGKHIHEVERVTSNEQGVIKRTVTDTDGKDAHHHEELTTLEKNNSISSTQHAVDDRKVDGTTIHEELDVVKVPGATKESHRVVTDKDTKQCHVHTEAVEKLSEIEGEKEAVVDSKVVLQKGNTTTVDVLHQEVNNKNKATNHHVESDRTEKDGTSVHEIRDTVTTEKGVQKQHAVVTDKDITDGHVHTEVVTTSSKNGKEQRAVADEKVVVKRGDAVTVDEIHKEAAIREDPKLGVCAAQHMEKDRDVGGAHIHEVTDTVKVGNVAEEVRTTVTDKDISEGHIHTEKVEKISAVGDKERKVVQETVVITHGDEKTLDVVHKESVGQNERALHHVESERTEGGELVREVTDTIEINGKTHTQQVIVTEKEADDGTHTYTETVNVIEMDGDECKQTTDEKVVVCNTDTITVDETHEEVTVHKSE
eukprot:TRINITY_DN729_c0_g2_i1.p1 TRINITY_DN729_c0_g2~~TRINITY_DN729_c0_g2_i1.p1  ORF type:complete len:526 (+),score=187.18 TRINITY_DN729_c0_g2_i1:58-1635(+)